MNFTIYFKKTIWIMLLFLAFQHTYSQQYLVENYGVKSNEIVDNAKQIQSAIDACAEKGGGTVIFSKGMYYSGTLQLKSNVHLKIESGSTLKGIPDTTAFKKFNQVLLVVWM